MPRGKRHGTLFRRLCDPQQLESSWQEVLRHYKKGQLPPALEESERRRGREIQRLAEQLRSRSSFPSQPHSSTRQKPRGFSTAVRTPVGFFCEQRKQHIHHLDLQRSS
jgi:hypothetical protein